MPLLGVEESVHEHGVEEGAGNFELMAIKNVEIELEIVPDLLCRKVEEFLQCLVMNSVIRKVVSGADFNREGDSKNVSCEAVEGGCLKVEAVGGRCFQFVEEVFLECGSVD